MSKTEQISKEQTKDNFAAFQQSSNKYFADIENSKQRYQQATSDLQDEYIKAWKNVVNANITLQKEFANKTAFNSNLPEATQNVIENITESVIKTRSVRDQIAVDSVVQNFQHQQSTCCCFAGRLQSCLLSVPLIFVLFYSFSIDFF